MTYNSTRQSAPLEGVKLFLVCGRGGFYPHRLFPASLRARVRDDQKRRVWRADCNIFFFGKMLFFGRAPFREVSHQPGVGNASPGQGRLGDSPLSRSP